MPDLPVRQPRNMTIIRLPAEAGEEGGVDFHAAPEVAEAEGMARCSTRTFLGSRILVRNAG